MASEQTSSPEIQQFLCIQSLSGYYSNMFNSSADHGLFCTFLVNSSDCSIVNNEPEKSFTYN